MGSTVAVWLDLAAAPAGPWGLAPVLCLGLSRALRPVSAALDETAPDVLVVRHAADGDTVALVADVSELSLAGVDQALQRAGPGPGSGARWASVHVLDPSIELDELWPPADPAAVLTMAVAAPVLVPVLVADDGSFAVAARTRVRLTIRTARPVPLADIGRIVAVLRHATMGADT